MTDANRAPRTTDLTGKVALVTGASAGIGRAVARRLAAAGMQLAVCARRRDRVDALCNEIAKEHPGSNPLSIVCDLRREADIAGMFAQIRERHGGVDVLVNNAGLGRDAPLMTGNSDDWREMLEVNVLALCICTREAIADMRKRGDDGHIVHIASMAAYRVPLRSGVYSATKFAVRSLTEGLRCELRAAKSGIRISAVSPGFVETEFAGVYAKGDAAAAEQTYGAYRCLQPEDIAASVHFVLAAPPHMQVHDVLLRPTEQEN